MRDWQYVRYSSARREFAHMDGKIKVYGATWCNDCKRAKQFLGDQRVAFEWHDIEQDPEGLEIVHERNNGNNVIPTIIFPDGTSLSEPSNEDGKIKGYGATWCNDCKRAKQFLGDQRVAFEWHDIEQDPEGLEIVHERNNGNNVIPTI